MLPIRTQLSFKNIHRLKVKTQKNIFHANRNQKRVEVTILKAKQNRL